MQGRNQPGLIAVRRMAAAIVGALVLVAVSGSLSAAAQTLRIGLSLPLTGSASLLARQFLHGANLAVADLAAGRQIVLVTVDDGCTPDMARLAAQELQEANIAVATGFLCNEAVPPVAAALKDAAIPMLLSGARSVRLLKDARKEGWNLWRLAPDDARPASAAFEALSQRWRGQAWALIDDGTVYGRTLADELRARMEEAGHPPVFTDNLRPAQSTQAAIVRRLVKSGATAAFIAADAEDVATVWSNIVEKQLNTEIAGGDALATLPWLENAAGLPDGLLAVSEPELSTLPGTASLNARLARENIEPEPHVYLGYMAVQVALSALRQTPALTTSALETGIFETILGELKFNAGQSSLDHYRLQIWSSGRFVEPAELAQ